MDSARRAQELDPLSLIANAVFARVLFFDGRYDEAIAQSRKTLEMDENVFLARLILGRNLAKKGDHDTAIAELERLREVPGGNSETTSLLAHTLASAGRTAEAGKRLGEMIQLSQKRYVQPYDIAVVHVGLGNVDAAFEWLERAYHDRNHQIPLIATVPEFEGLRTDPRWNGFAGRFESRR